MGNARPVSPKRGEVFLVSFDPSIGSEIKKTRPALVLQNDIGNRYSPLTIVAAITSFDGGKVYPTDVVIEPGQGGVEHRSAVLLDQIRTVDKRRLIVKIGKLDAGTMRQVDAALLISLGLAE